MSAIKEGAVKLCDTVSNLMPMREENGRRECDKYVLRPLDIVLFEGDSSDPVSAFIKSITVSIHSPQIRDFAAVVAEGNMTVAVAPLKDDFRQLALEKLKQNPNLLLDVHKEFEEYTFPIPNILPAIAAAEDTLYKQLESFKKSVSTIFPQAGVNAKPEIFCSELVAIIFQRMGLPSFTDTNADQMTPVSLEACQEFGGNVVYPKEFRTQ
ncbi:hypothetical protein HDU80_010857 [Chytriomyces hyalinus]|nr:hypothetical protein HDU80_010857 [Chytriomyces hyalinus]